MSTKQNFRVTILGNPHHPFFSAFRAASFFLVLLVFLSSKAGADDYTAAWEKINNNDRQAALKILDPKIKSGTASTDEYMTWNFLTTFNGRDEDIRDFEKYAQKTGNADPYYYALWFNSAVAGSYGKKTPQQLAFLNQLILAKPGNGTLRAASNYQMSHHYVSIHQLPMVSKSSAKIGAITNWQYVGPFDNISGSGFDKNYGPVKDTSSKTEFKSHLGATIHWFTPPVQANEGWVFTENFIADGEGRITFAQTFVKSDADVDAYLCAGFSGTLKVWVNDKLLIAVSDESTTEIDAYTSKCQLKKGYNRILVQVGSTDVSPNYILRITDTNRDPLSGITSVAAPQPYPVVGGEDLSGLQPHFAEVYFQEKIRNDSGNLVNYCLLNRVYLRSEKAFEARKTIEAALARAPENSILKYELLLCYMEEDNNTGVSELFEYFKDKEQSSYISYILRINELKRLSKYQEIIDTTDARIELYGADEATYNDKIQALAQLDKVPALLSLIREAYDKYPDNDQFVNYMYNVEKSINKNPKKALKFLANYLETHYEYNLVQLLISEYFNQNDAKTPYRIMQEQVETWPHHNSLRTDQIDEYMGQQRYNEALEACNFLIELNPFCGKYYDTKAQVEESMGREQDAIKSYQKAVNYKPTLYASRDKLRRLQKKPIILEKIYEEITIDSLLRNTGKGIKLENYDYYYIQYETNVMIYPEGGREEVHTAAIKILNQRGIDEFKDFSIPYNSNSESLLIEEAQIIKPNGKKSRPETSGNQIVCTGLEANDVVYFRYRNKSYLSGRLAREFYDKFIFDGFIPVELARYVLVMPENRTFDYKILNGSLEPKVRTQDNFKIYEWRSNVTKAIEDEPYMPPAADFAMTLHVSTFRDWNEIARWYSDVVYSKIASENDYAVNTLGKELFEGKKNLTAEAKARIIYDYIAKNINYSSVSFRQSGLIPQRASETISTRLGDCKDISTLFVSLANRCDLKANLVLVSTRDNGKKDMFLPSFLFNHCIVKYTDEKNKDHYLELTDRELPFRSLPSNLYQALSLTIPAKNGDTATARTLASINTSGKTKDRIITRARIDIDGSNMNLVSTNIKYGSLTTYLRSTYRSMSDENINKRMEESVSKQFTNPVKVEKVTFKALDECVDSISVTMDMNVVNAVKKIGAQSAFTLPFSDVLFTTVPFTLKARTLDFEYWDYESADSYETQLDVYLPAGKTFAEVPQSEKLNFRNFRYSITYKTVAPNHLRVTRLAETMRDNVTPAEYSEFKDFVTKVLDKEGSYVSFK